MKVLILLLAGLSAAFVSFPNKAQDAARMDAVTLSYVDSRSFMGAVLVARDGEVLLDKGYGSANLEWNIPNTPETKFRLGSITKQFTAASILLLEERGKLSTNDPIRKYLPDAPAAWDKITVFNLLTHSSGIPNFTSFPEYKQFERLATPVVELVAKFRDKPLDFAPGEKMNYSNSGYVLLGYLIEKISGQSYERFVQENIFTPLGMKASGYDSNSKVISQRASGYSPSSSGPVNAEFVDMSVPHGAGALYSTTHDLLRWHQGLFGGKLLSAASLAKMTTPFKSDYGFGLIVQTIDGRKRISHSGGIEGFNTSLVYFPDTKVTVVALGNLNGNSPDQITAHLGRLAHGNTVTLVSERKEIQLSGGTLATYIGTYELTPEIKLMVTLDGDQLMTQLSGQRKFPVYAQSETMFFLKVVDAQLEFVKNTQGAVTAAILHQNGRDQTARRVSDTVVERKEIAVAREVLGAYAGTYAMNSLADMVVTVEDGHLVTQLGSQPKVPVFAESETLFFAKVIDAQIEFKKDAAGKVTALVLHQGSANIEAPRK